MRIDEQVEPRVREALAGVVKRDPARFEAALKTLQDTGSLQHGIELATAITTVVLAQVFGGMPSPEQRRELAAAISELESWAEPTPEEIETFLAALAEHRPLDGVLAPEQVTVLAFLLAGSLLASRAKEEDGAWWFNVLDQVEAIIERAN